MCQGLLDLEGSLAPILFHMVRKDVDKLLDNAFVAEEMMIRYIKCDTVIHKNLPTLLGLSLCNHND